VFQAILADVAEPNEKKAQLTSAAWLRDFVVTLRLGMLKY
jgi:hypothetical protein